MRDWRNNGANRLDATGQAPLSLNFCRRFKQSPSPCAVAEPLLSSPVQHPPPQTPRDAAGCPLPDRRAGHGGGAGSCQIVANVACARTRSSARHRCVAARQFGMPAAMAAHMVPGSNDRCRCKQESVSAVLITRQPHSARHPTTARWGETNGRHCHWHITTSLPALVLRASSFANLVPAVL